jgi:hypothetical protein
VAEPLKRHWTTHVGQAAGHPAAFLVVILYAVLWLTFDRATFDWNAVATIWRCMPSWMSYCASMTTHGRSLPSLMSRSSKSSPVIGTKKCVRQAADKSVGRKLDIAGSGMPEISESGSSF